MAGRVQIPARPGVTVRMDGTVPPTTDSLPAGQEGSAGGAKQFKEQASLVYRDLMNTLGYGSRLRLLKLWWKWTTKTNRRYKSRRLWRWILM